MRSRSTYFRPQAQVLSVLGAFRTTGFCHNCERVSRWVDHVDHYSCDQCGRDPLLKADTPFELNLRAFDRVPAGLVAPKRSLRKTPQVRNLRARIGAVMSLRGGPRRPAHATS